MENLEKKYNVSDVKELLYLEIKKHFYDVDRSKKLKDEVSILNDIYDILSSDVDTINDEIAGIEALLHLVYDDVTASKMDSIIRNYVATFKYSDVLEDKQKSLNNFKLIRRQIYENMREKSIENSQLFKSTFFRKDKIDKYKQFLRYIENDGFIADKDLELFVDFLKSKDVPFQNILGIIEAIKTNHLSKKDEFSKKVNYNMLNMFKAKFDKFEISDLDEYQFREHDPLINLVIDLFRKNEIDSLLLLLPSLSDQNLSLEEYDYIFKNIFNNIIDILQENIDEIDDIESYKELGVITCEEYYRNFQNYKIITALYYKEREKYFKNDELKEENLIESNDNEDKPNRIIYLRANNSSESYLERDILKNIPQELYDDIIRLLEDLKNGTLLKRNTKGFTSNNKLKGFKELKEDQLRVIYKNIGSDIFVILGAFQKKRDNDRSTCIKVVSRYNPNKFEDEKRINDELNETLNMESELYQKLRVAARKGSR